MSVVVTRAATPAEQHASVSKAFELPFIFESFVTQQIVLNMLTKSLFSV